MIFLDANVFMYAAGTESPHRDPCRRVLSAVVRNGLGAVTNTDVIQEILYRYQRAGQVGVAIRRAREAMAIVSTVLPVEREDMERAMAWLDQHRDVGVRDAVHAACALRWRCASVVSADRGFDHLASEGIVRVDPQDLARTLPCP